MRTWLYRLAAKRWRPVVESTFAKHPGKWRAPNEQRNIEGHRSEPDEIRAYLDAT
jgi:hypothetical protein